MKWEGEGGEQQQQFVCRRCKAEVASEEVGMWDGVVSCEGNQGAVHCDAVCVRVY